MSEISKCLNCGKVVISSEDRFLGWCSMECYQEMQNKALDALSGEQTGVE